MIKFKNYFKNSFKNIWRFQLYAVSLYHQTNNKKNKIMKTLINTKKELNDKTKNEVYAMLERVAELTDCVVDEGLNFRKVPSKNQYTAYFRARHSGNQFLQEMRCQSGTTIIDLLKKQGFKIVISKGGCANWGWSCIVGF